MIIVREIVIIMVYAEKNVVYVSKSILIMNVHKSTNVLKIVKIEVYV